MPVLLPPKEADGLRRYGRWAGNPIGDPENSEQCAAECYEPVGLRRYQCSRERGHGHKGLFCSQHARMYEREKTTQGISQVRKGK